MIIVKKWISMKNTSQRSNGFGMTSIGDSWFTWQLLISDRMELEGHVVATRQQNNSMTHGLG